jgi:hypothetical protein
VKWVLILSLSLTSGAFGVLATAVGLALARMPMLERRRWLRVFIGYAVVGGLLVWLLNQTVTPEGE